jgi:hypothetical protein
VATLVVHYSTSSSHFWLTLNPVSKPKPMSSYLLGYECICILQYLLLLSIFQTICHIFFNLILTHFTDLWGKENRYGWESCGLDSWSTTDFWKNDTAAVHAISKIQYSYYSLASLEKNAKTAASILGNHALLGPMNFFDDTLHSLIAAFCFHHSWALLSSAPKIAVALRFPLSYVHQTTSHLNFSVYVSPLEFVSLP